MRVLVLLLAMIFSAGLVAQQTATPDGTNISGTKGNCSPAVSGTKNAISITCTGFDKKQAAEMAKIMTIVGKSQLTLDQVLSALGAIGHRVEAISHPLFNDSLRILLKFSVEPSQATEAYLARVGPTLQHQYRYTTSEGTLPPPLPNTSEDPVTQLLVSHSLPIVITAYPKENKSGQAFLILGGCESVDAKSIRSRRSIEAVGAKSLYLTCQDDKPTFSLQTNEISTFADLLDAKLCVLGLWPKSLQIRPLQVQILNNGWSVHPTFNQAADKSFMQCADPIRPGDFSPRLDSGR